MDNQILIWSFGFLGMLFACILAYIFDNRKHILLMRILGTAFFGVYFYLLGLETAVVNNSISVLFLILSYHRARLPHKDSPLYPLFFLILNTYFSLQRWQGGISALSYSGSCMSIVARWQNNTKYIRSLSMIATIIWLAHNGITQAWFAFIASIFSFTSLSVAIYRFDIRHKKQKVVK